MYKVNYNHKKVAGIVKKYKGDKTLRKFAKELCEGVKGVNLTYQAVHCWEHGKFLPNTNTMLTIYANTGDWRHDFAAEVLRVVNPDFYNQLRSHELQK